MSLHYRRNGTSILVLGHTYPHRDTLRSLGAVFDRDYKAWRLTYSDTNEEAIRAVCLQFGGGRLDEIPAGKTQTPSHEAKELLVVEDVIKEKSPQSLSVAQLINSVHLHIAAAFPQSVWVTGEIHNLQHRGKAIYLQLCEPKSTTSNSQGTISLSVTIWQSVWLRCKNDEAKYGQITQLLSDGLAVRFLCQVGIYRDRGIISLNVLDIDPSYSMGALALAREKLLRELRAAGLDRKNKNLVMPRLPFRIGLISAIGSRAYSDFCNQLELYNFPGTVVFCDARMQGEQTTTEVLKALDELKAQTCDVIIITRGGGSAADLRWFNERALALAVANSSVPVVAAIGHHEDVSIIEEIAFRHEKTPTAAADFILQLFAIVRKEVDRACKEIDVLGLQACARSERLLAEHYGKLEKSAANFLHKQSELLNLLNFRIDTFARTMIDRCYRTFDNYIQSINQNWQTQLHRLVLELESLKNKITAIDPRPWIALGWTQLSTGGRPIRSIKDTAVGAKIQALLRDGDLVLEVKSLSEAVDKTLTNTP